MNSLRNMRIALSIILFLLAACTNASEPVQSIRIELSSNPGPVAQRASELLAREINERSNADVVTNGKAEFTVELAIKPGIGAEGFTIADNGSNSVKIIGNDENGLLYGVGKFLHTSAYCPTGFTPGSWRGTSVPKSPIRGIHTVNHFGNFYEASNDEERTRYIEDMALWGTNSLLVVFESSILEGGFDDPKAQAALRKLSQMMLAAKSVGMKVGLAFGNDLGFTTTPKEFRSTEGPRIWGGVLICPSKPAAMDHMINHLNRLLDELKKPGLDFVLYWPYDNGGCNCKDCAPWGANGFPKMCRKFTSVVRAKYPNAKFILATWLFDFEKYGLNGKMELALKNDGEYAGLDKFLQKDKSWVDYLMVDAHEGFPEYPLKYGAPGGLPMINFPEISMWGTDPVWGGFGANPLPDRFQNLWNQVKGKLVGGFLYSEGLFEDINKVVYSQFYWNPDCLAKETVKEYIAYEYSPSVVDSVSKAIQLLENNLMRKMSVGKKLDPNCEWYLYGVYIGGSRIEFLNPDRTPLSSQDKINLEKNVNEAFNLLDRADKQLTPNARASWQWRILYLRALIDRELIRTDGWLEGPTLKMAFDELTRIYHSENASTCLHVPWIEDADVKSIENTDK